MDGRERKGIIFALMAYIIWGMLPIYWRNLKGVSAFELLYYRIILSFFSLK